MQVIKFDKNAIQINCIVKIGFTNRAYQDLNKLTDNPETYIAALSKQSRMIITPDKKKDDMFSLHTSFGNFLCAVNKKTEDGFSVIAYRENDLYLQNNALKRGIIFSAEKGIVSEVLLPAEEIHYKYLAGEKYDYNALDCGNTQPAVEVIIDEIRACKGSKKEEISSEEQSPNFGKAVDYEEQYFKELLKQAEQYSILSSELDEKKTHELGKMSYKAFYAAEYDRIDRIAYSFIVDDIDKKVFKVGVQVEFEGRNGERINGEIVEVDTTDKENISILVLFNTQISIDMFNDFGWISVSYSTVNKDVQLEANARLVDGSAKAKYMKNLLGGNKTDGFDNKDLSEIRTRLQKQQYPPNASQIAAIEKGINSKDVFLVMGPPGTGKTTVILEWVKYFVGVEHKRVLVSSQNNKAVDNVLVRLLEEKDIDVIRIGSEAKMQQEVIPYMFENKLTALNKKINAATSNIISSLEQLIKEWSEYRGRFYVFKQRLAEIEALENSLRDGINRQLVPIKLRQKKVYADYQEARATYTAAQIKYNECLNAIESYEKKNFILKKLLAGRHQGNLNARAQLEVIIENSKARLKSASEKYNKYAEMYERLKAVLRDKFISDMKRVKKRNIKEVDKFNNERPAVSEIAGLFRELYFTIEDIQSVTAFYLFLDKIDKEIERAQMILSVERKWRENTVGKQNYALNEIVLETVDLVGATCIGVSSQKRFANLQFDVTIIDEAGQIQIHNALVPMSVSNKLIMLGDYKQIPPSFDQELLELCELNGVDPELLKMSLFEKLFVELPESNKIMLDTQYRMPGEIADIISEWFYDGEYKSPDFKRNLKSILPGLSKKPLLLIDTSGVPDRFETRTQERGTFNVLEADICKDILEYIIRNKDDLSMSEIGIISAYGDQVARIKKVINQVIPLENVNAMVATLDSFQGQERNLIIYSFTKSSRKKPTMSRIGFLNELRRLNVAMSRCKKSLIMIGDMRFLSGCVYQNTDDDGNDIYEHSEKEFSDFIKKMLRDVRGGRGELIKYKQFKERIGS